MKSYKLSEAEDLLIGKKGTKERDEKEFELKLELPSGALLQCKLSQLQIIDY